MFLIPVAATAGPSRELRHTHDELHDLRRRLHDQQTRARGVKVRIAALNLAITDAQIALENLDADIAEIRSEIRTALARRDETRARIEAIQELARDQAVELYKGGSSDTLAALLEARSVSELNDRIELLGVAAEQNTGALVRFGRLRLQIQAQNQVVFAKEAQLARSRDRQAELLDRQSRLRVELTTGLQRLRHRIGREETREGRLVRAARALRKKVLAAQATRDAMSLGTSSRGFIWPLNGPVTSGFGSRWGSMHTGIDIDGYTGQPVVAAKGGRVIEVGDMSGYGNVVVLDHGGGVSSLYAHLSGYETSTGATVQRGRVVGYVGCTGNCYGDHLHFEVRLNGSPTNPLDLLP